MLGFIAGLLVYSIAITVAVVLTTAQKDKYYRKYRELEDQLKRLNAPAQGSQAPVQAQPQVQPQIQPQVQQNPQVQIPQPQPLQSQQPQPAYRPAPAPARAPLPTYTASAKAPARKSGSTAVGVSFSVGVLLMVIAAAVFISATWQTMLPVLKCIVLVLVVSCVYVLSTVSRVKLKLLSTSSVLYMLASLITPLAIFVGFLAFDVREELITLVCCALSLGVSGFIGYKIFGTKLQVAVSYLGFVWSEIFICMELFGNARGFSFGLCAAAFVSGLIYYVKPKLKFFDLFAEITAYVAFIGFLMTAAFTESMIVPFITACVLYWVSLLMLTRKRKWIAYVSGFVPFYVALVLKIRFIDSRTVYIVTVFLMIAFLMAFYRIIKHENFMSNMFSAVWIPTLLYIVSEVTGRHNNGSVMHDFMYYAVFTVAFLACVAVCIMSRQKAERNIYLYLVFFAAVAQCHRLIEGIVPIVIFLVLAAGSVLLNYRKKALHLQIASCASSVIVFLMNIKPGDPDVNSIVFALGALALYGAVVLINKLTSVDRSAHIAARFNVLPMLIAGFMAVFIRGLVLSDACFVVLAAGTVIFTVFTLLDTDNYFGIMPAAMFMAAVMVKLLKYDILDNSGVSLLFVAVFPVIGRFLFCRRVVAKGRIDWLTFLAGIACFIPVMDMSLSLLYVTLYIMMFAGRFAADDASLLEKLSYKFRVIASCAIGSLTLCLVTLDMEFSSVMDTEIRLMFMLVAAFAVYLFVLPGTATRWIWFSTVALCIQIEAFHALGRQLLIPLTLISVCAIGIFIYSFIFKKRSWFILAIATIGEFALLFAVVFWESRLWWIYLLVLGGILIATASVNEYRRRKAIESGADDKKVRLFENWTW